MPASIRYARSLLLAFIVGWIFVVVAEFVQSKGLISQLTESVSRLIVWALLMLALLYAALRSSGKVSWLLWVFFLCTAVSVTTDIPALDGNPWIGRDGTHTHLVKKLLFGGWACALAAQFLRLYQELHETNLQLTKQVEDAQISEGRYRQLLDSHLQSDAELRKLRAEVAHSARISMLGEMAGGLAHELNQPLAAISNFAYSAKVKLSAIEHPSVSEINGLMESVLDQSQRAGAVIRRLKKMVEKSGPARSTVDINEVIEEVVSLIESEVRIGNIQLTLELAPDLPKLLLDRIQIQQVILNLLRNALDAVLDAKRSGGRIVVASKMHGEEHVEVTVADNGIGIASDPMDSIFDAFESTKQSGMGMGLAICKSIIEQHGGRIWAEQDVSEGAVFHITLTNSTA